MRISRNQASFVSLLRHGEFLGSHDYKTSLGIWGNVKKKNKKNNPWTTLYNQSSPTVL